MSQPDDTTLREALRAVNEALDEVPVDYDKVKDHLTIAHNLSGELRRRSWINKGRALADALPPLIDYGH
jgi:hypothetical protein